MIIRDANSKDLQAIADINNYFRLHSNHIWSRTLQTLDDMNVWLLEHTKLPYCAIVAEEGGTVLGYASLSQFRPHEGYRYTAEDSIYLKPDETGKGYGRALMTHLLERAKANGIRVITSWIDSGNKTSVEFHEKFGFRYVGTMPNAGILDGEAVSVIIMQLDLNTQLIV